MSAKPQPSAASNQKLPANTKPEAAAGNNPKQPAPTTPKPISVDSAHQTNNLRNNENSDDEEANNKSKVSVKHDLTPEEKKELEKREKDVAA